jgi:DNA-binding NarL/FixJ family response regulator
MRRVMFETIKAVAALHRGANAEALRYTQTVLDLVGPPAWGVVVGIPLSLAVRAATELGDFPAAMSYLNVPVPPAMFDTPFALPYLQALGRYHLAMGHPQTALTHFHSCGELMAKWRLDTPDMVDWRNDAAAALIAMGRIHPARALIEEQLSWLVDRRSRVGGIALRRLAATSSMPARLTLLQEAVRILRASGDSVELAHAQAELAAAQKAMANSQVSVSVPFPVNTSKRTYPDRPDGETYAAKAELTDAQRRVAALAAAGATNRQIADTLFVTVSTVEQHLTKIYRKLGVRQRSELSAQL